MRYAKERSTDLKLYSASSTLSPNDGAQRPIFGLGSDIQLKPSIAGDAAGVETA